jgi:hypothetical protein
VEGRHRPRISGNTLSTLPLRNPFPALLARLTLQRCLENTHGAVCSRCTSPSSIDLTPERTCSSTPGVILRLSTPPNDKLDPAARRITHSKNDVADFPYRSNRERAPVWAGCSSVPNSLCCQTALRAPVWAVGVFPPPIPHRYPLEAACSRTTSTVPAGASSGKSFLCTGEADLQCIAACP